MKYNVQSKDYLARAQRERSADDTERLIYSALELRAGVEARLHEYRDAVQKKKRNNTWQVRILKREIENIVDKYDNPVTIHFQDPATGMQLPLRYVPIAEELKSIAERLGQYMHCLPASKVQMPTFFTELTTLIDRGIDLLSESVSGDLLSPPMRNSENMAALFIFDEGKSPTFLEKGRIAKFDAKFVEESKSESGITLKIA